MGKRNKYGKFIFIAAIFLSLIVYLVYTFYKSKESFSTNENIQLVISRYNENLDWIKDYPYNKYPNIIYNKSDNSNFSKSEKTIKIVSLPNVGRCDHTYLYHVIKNYDNLANITVFLPGSANMENKKHKSTRLLKEIETNNQNVFLCSKYENVQNELYDFQLDGWKASDEKNSILNPEMELDNAKIRPFGKWFSDKFDDLKIEYVSYFGIFSVNKKEILQHPKSYYEELIKDLETSSNPEAGHFFERSWAAIFHPMSETKFIQE
jgi:hypothetical protein